MIITMIIIMIITMIITMITITHTIHSTTSVDTKTIEYHINDDMKLKNGPLVFEAMSKDVKLNDLLAEAAVSTRKCVCEGRMIWRRICWSVLIVSIRRVRNGK